MSFGLAKAVDFSSDHAWKGRFPRRHCPIDSARRNVESVASIRNIDGVQCAIHVFHCLSTGALIRQNVLNRMAKAASCFSHAVQHILSDQSSGAQAVEYMDCALNAIYVSNGGNRFYVPSRGINWTMSAWKPPFPSMIRTKVHSLG